MTEETAPTERPITLTNAEVLCVGPDDRVIVFLPRGDEGEDHLAGDVVKELERLGLADRSLVFVGDVKFVVVKPQ